MHSSKSSLRHTRTFYICHNRHRRFLSSSASRRSLPDAIPRFGAFAERNPIPPPVRPVGKQNDSTNQNASARSDTMAKASQGDATRNSALEPEPTARSRDNTSLRKATSPLADDLLGMLDKSFKPEPRSSGIGRYERPKFDERPSRSEAQRPPSGSLGKSTTANGSATDSRTRKYNGAFDSFVSRLDSTSNAANAYGSPSGLRIRRYESDKDGRRSQIGSSSNGRDAYNLEQATSKPRPVRPFRESDFLRNKRGFDRNRKTADASPINRNSWSTGQDEKPAGWRGQSWSGATNASGRRVGISKWGEFDLPTDEGFKAPVILPVSNYAADAPQPQSSKTAGILSRHKRRQGRYADDAVEEQSSKKQPKAKNTRRSRDEDEDDDRNYKMEKADYLAAKEARKKKKAKEAQRAREEAEQRRWQIKLPPYISIANLAKALNVRFEDFIEKMEKLGFKQLAHDHVLSTEDAGLVAQEYGFDAAVEVSSENIVAAPWPTDPAELEPRPPVVTIMGHVDHGKTTILDYLRKSSIAAGEFGGITQHIGAFSVPLSSGRTITFLDTPGHSAFLSMRQRGANVTDIVVLVVAADDGIMPQTLEALKHAKAANVPIIVAVNKIDKGEADLARIKLDLSRHDVDIEDNGGEVQVVPVSGKTGQGMDDLEESIITLSEILDHKAPQKGNVEGWVLEASTKAHGRVATVLIRRGVLQPGDIIVSGTQWGRVRTLRNEFGVPVESVGPGVAVEIDGWRDDLPSPGDEVLQADDEQHAAAVVRTREDLAAGIKAAQDMEAINDIRRESRETAAAAAEAAPVVQRRRTRHSGVALDQSALRERKIDGAFREVSRRPEGVHEAVFVVKADVEGSVEAVVDLVASLGNARARPNIVRASAGAVTESDVELAYAAQGHILAFNTEIDNDIRARADRAGVRIIEQRVIYRVAETVNAILTDLLPEIVTQRVTGEAEVLQSFGIKVAAKVAASKQLLVAGCRVRNGVVTRGSRVRVLRGGKSSAGDNGSSSSGDGSSGSSSSSSSSEAGTIVYDGILESLKNVKKDVNEMKNGTECGMAFGDGWQDFRPGDQVQCYTEHREKDKL